MARSKVKSRSRHDVAHLHPLTNVPTRYQLPTPYGFRDIARTRFYAASVNVKNCCYQDLHQFPFSLVTADQTEVQSE